MQASIWVRMESLVVAYHTPLRLLSTFFFAYAWHSSLRIYRSSSLSCIALHH